MKRILFAIVFLLALNLQAQSVEGRLSLNGKSKTTLELKNASAVHLLSEFKEGKYRLNFEFEADNLVGFYQDESGKRKVVFYEFKTVVKRNGRLVKNVIRKNPIPYFPGEYSLSAEAFDFVGTLAENPMEEEEMQMLKKGGISRIIPGTYSIELSVRPIGAKGGIKPVVFNFTVK
ncbi:hypothetical protein [Aureicoccus marinus]|uniref:Uncharacterized protein n=1 Tax=Aureicoccus marinus TaxID=754435 RepID=A0A2S7T7A0_9FLAO|nr:hypothetical protein [Aureicoccus marinus]PQJ15326.1 hypothetical protein BST99_05870 [Aureicoccus marinus]